MGRNNTDDDKCYSVYMHTTPDGKRYVGMTRCTPKKRWGGGANYRSMKSFYQAIRHYGWDNIKHEVLETGLTRGEARQKEMEYIALYRSAESEYGYNLSVGADVAGDSTRALWSKQRSERKGELSPRSRPVYQIKPSTMEIMREYVSAREAATVMGYKLNSISQVCRRKGKFVTRFYEGYFWCYADEYEKQRFDELKGIELRPDGSFPKPSWYNAMSTQESRERIKKAVQKPVMNIETGKTYGSVSEAANAYGCSVSTISICLDKPNRTACGYHWTHTERRREVSGE